MTCETTPMAADGGACPHIEAVEEIKQPTARVCDECVAIGSRWVHLQNLSGVRRHAVLRLVAQSARQQARAHQRPPLSWRPPSKANARCTATETMLRRILSRPEAPGPRSRTSCGRTPTPRCTCARKWWARSRLVRDTARVSRATQVAYDDAR